MCELGFSQPAALFMYGCCSAYFDLIGDKCNAANMGLIVTGDKSSVTYTQRTRTLM